MLIWADHVRSFCGLYNSHSKCTIICNLTLCLCVLIFCASSHHSYLLTEFFKFSFFLLWFERYAFYFWCFYNYTFILKVSSSSILLNKIKILTLNFPFPSSMLLFSSLFYFAFLVIDIYLDLLIYLLPFLLAFYSFLLDFSSLLLK